MRYSTPLIFELARSVNEAERAAADAVVQVPTVIVPHISLQRAQRLTTSNLDRTERQRQSFIENFGVTRDATDGLLQVNTIISTFSTGLWRIGIFANLMSTATEVPAAPAAEALFVLLASPPTSLNYVLARLFRQQGYHSLELERTFLFDEDGWLVTIATNQPTVGSFIATVGLTAALLT